MHPSIISNGGTSANRDRHRRLGNVNSTPLR
jgi:hypothetical protein